MKKVILLVSIIFAGYSSQAGIITVNNNENGSGDFSTLQEAIDSESTEEGDTIYLVGSPNYYDERTEIRINKTITIIGPGYFLGENGPLQSSNVTAKIYSLNLGEGSDNTLITGVEFPITSSAIQINSENYTGGQGQSSPSGIKIVRNKIKSMYLTNANNTLIAENYIEDYSYPLRIYRDATNTIIRNNIIIGSRNSASIYGQHDEDLTNTVLINNTISGKIYRLDGTEIINNLFISGGLDDCDNNVMKNNLFTSSQNTVFTGNSTGNTFQDNEYEAVAANLFVKPEPTIDSDYKLAANSPARGIGLDGEDVGAFTNEAQSYISSGIPSVPSVYELSTNGYGTPSTGMKVTIKAKVNP